MLFGPQNTRLTNRFCVDIFVMSTCCSQNTISLRCNTSPADASESVSEVSRTLSLILSSLIAVSIILLDPAPMTIGGQSPIPRQSALPSEDCPSSATVGSPLDPSLGLLGFTLAAARPGLIYFSCTICGDNHVSSLEHRCIASGY